MDKKKFKIGAVIEEAGSTIKNKTGSWRTEKPIVDREKCNGDGRCWLFCPDDAIKIVNRKAVVYYDFCKGCGICALECPVKAIKMVKEKK